MKLLRYGESGREQPGLLDANGEIRSLADRIPDISGAALSEKILQGIQSLTTTSLPLVDKNTRLGPCVGSVGKFIGIGLNYADHAAETGADIPEEPEVFTKATSAIFGPDDDTIKPRNSTKLDWEVELGLVVGKHASYVDEEDAMAHIAGYCVVNDISERQFQLERGNQWDKGKGCDTFGPVGPWLVTRDEIVNPDNLGMWLAVNGHLYQNGNTKTMIFRPAFIVSYLSQFMSLQPGDIITTGTPAGVGLGQNPPTYLQEGDVVELGIDGLGTQRQTIVS